MFSHLSVSHSVYRGACVAGPGGMYGGGGHAWQGAGVRGRRDGHYSGRYASYWNAFLLEIFVQNFVECMANFIYSDFPICAM